MARMTGVVCMQKLRDWEAAFGALEAGVIAWPVWAPLAEAFVRGAWHPDVSARFQRDYAGNTGQLLAMPSQRLFRFRATGLCLPCVDILPPSGQVCELQRGGPRLGFWSLCPWIDL